MRVSLLLYSKYRYRVFVVLSHLTPVKKINSFSFIPQTRRNQRMQQKKDEEVIVNNLRFFYFQNT